MRSLIPVLCILALGGCYHATVETGATPSTVVLDKSFASSWIYGLVPPEIVSTAERCPDGVSKVETEHTFVNQLVGILTLGIYTPMRIRVTCAARGSASADAGSQPVVAAGAGATAKREAFARAVALARVSKQSVYIEF